MRPKEIRLDDIFKRHFAERISSNQALVELYENQLALFIKKRADPKVRDHALSWNMQGQRAFSIAKDIRVVYTETDTVFIFRDIGTHDRVYK